MFDFLTYVFDTTDFSPRWECGRWTAGHGWLHILSDLGIWSAYLAIPCVLGYFILRRQDIPFRTIFLLFGAFILACGTTHLMEALIFWWPAYRLAGVIKLLTALVSWATVVALVPVVPRVLAMRSSEELEQEITARKQAEDALQQANAELERRVEKRTAELAQANGALRSSEERLRLALEAGSMGTWEWNIPEQLVIWSPTLEAIHGLAPGTFPGTFAAYQKDIHPEDREHVLGSIAQALEKNTDHHLEYRIVWPDGSVHWIEARGKLSRDESGRPLRMLGVCMAIDGRKAVEEEVRFQAHLLDTVQQAAIATDPDGKIIYWNRFAETLYGWSKAEAIQRDILTVIPAPDSVAHATAIMNRLRSGESWSGELQVRRRDGTTFPALVTDTPIFQDHGRLTAIVGISTDITEQKHTEETFRFLAEASAALATLVDYESTLQRVARLAVPFFADWCAIDMLDADGTLRRLAVAHVDPAKVQLAHELHERYPPDPAAPQGLWHILRTGQAEFISEIPDALLVEMVKDEELLRSLRELGLQSYIGVPLQVQEKTLGVITFIAAESGRHYDANDLAVAKDLAHRAAVAIDNARLYREVREADRRKDEFLATLAHELRNPLAPIKNSVQILQLRGLDDAHRHWARDVIARQVEQMTRLVDDLLDISRINRGKIELRKQVVNLADIVNGAVETTRPLLEERQHALTVSLPVEPVYLKADPTRLEQILANLLNNSAKYTEPGGQVWLTAQREGTTVVIKVRDTGIGIGPELLPRLFEMFVQADHAKDRAQGGLGIGLSLVRRLVEMHGGSITAHSNGPGQGSEFSVRLALLTEGQQAEVAAALPDAKRPGARAARRILVVDDSVDAAESLARLLRLSGHEVQVAYDGRTAVEAVQATAPELVFLDIGLPGLDGYEVARQIRRVPGGEALFLVAVTGWGQEEDRRRSQAAGFDQHLVKPVELGTLHRLLSDLNSSRGKQKLEADPTGVIGPGAT